MTHPTHPDDRLTAAWVEDENTGLDVITVVDPCAADDELLKLSPLDALDLAAQLAASAHEALHAEKWGQ